MVPKHKLITSIRHNHMTHINSRIGVMMLAVMLAACSNSDSTDDSTGTSPQNEIRLRADVWYVMPGTRATTYAGGEQTSGSFTAAAYVENTTTPYINPVQVNWDTGKWVWNDGKHYWPATGNLDFFAYMPATAPTYITTGPTYSISGTPQAQFTCTDIPMIYDAASPTGGQGSDLMEFVWAMTVGQNKTNAGEGVTMKFRHPFARINFQLAANHTKIQINSIIFKNVKTGGTCTLNGTDIAETFYYTTSVWSSLTPAEGGSDLVMTLANKDGEGNWIAADVNTFNTSSSATPIGGYSSDAHQFVDLIMVPQTFAGTIEVNASWNDWGDTPVPHTVTTTIPPINWEAGKSYTYTFNISTDDLVVNVSNFTEQW